jgi:hypothetical protein
LADTLPIEKYKENPGTNPTIVLLKMKVSLFLVCYLSKWLVLLSDPPPPPCINPVERNGTEPYHMSEAHFIVPDWGMKPTMASGCPTGQTAYVAWRAESTTRRHIAGFIPQSGFKNTATKLIVEYVGRWGMVDAIPLCNYFSTHLQDKMFNSISCVCFFLKFYVLRKALF